MSNSFKKLFLIFLGLFWICITIYRYLFLQREALYIQPTDNFAYKATLLFVFFLNILLLILYNFKSVKLMINNLWDLIYWKPLLFIFDTYIKEIDGIGDVLIYLSERVIALYKVLRAKFGLTLCLLLFIIPKLILAFAYFYDVYYRNHFYIFFYLLPTLLIFLLLTRMLIYVLRDFSYQNKVVLDDFLDVIVNDGSYRITFKDRYVNNSVDKLNLYAYRYGLFKDVHYFCNKLYAVETWLNGYIMPVLFYLYTLGTLKILMISSGYIIKDTFYIIVFFIGTLCWLFYCLLLTYKTNSR